MDIQQLIRNSQKDHRVDVIDLARQLNVDVYAVDMSDDKNGCIQYQKDLDKFFIEVNSNHPVTRQRFTIAHELGHLLKHRELIKNKGQLDRSNEFSDENEIRHELQADKQAAEILMPKPLVEDYLSQKNWGAKTKFNAEMISDIAEHFRVSRAMAVLRLRELKLPIPYISFA